MNQEDIIVQSTSSGIPVLIDRLPNSRIAGFMVCYGTGSRDESPDQFGISHLLEHVMFRGTENRTSLETSKAIESAGGQLNAFTSKEMTAYYGVALDSTQDVTMNLVADTCVHPLLRQEDIDLEKKIVLQEISMWRNEPDSYVHKVFCEALWSGHPLSQNEAGEEDVVMSLDEVDLQDYYRNRYRQPNLSVYASGNVDPEKVLAWAEESFDPMKGGMTIERSAPSGKGTGFLLQPRDGDHSYVAMGFPAFDAKDERRPALRLLNAIMGGGMSSRLFQQVREEKALVYSIYNTGEQYTDAGNLWTFFSSTDENVAEAMGIVAREYHLLKEEGLREGELERAKNLIAGSIAKNMESTSSRLYRLNKSYMLTGRPRTFEEELAQLASVSEEDVMKVAGDVLHDDRMTVVVYGQENDSLVDIRGGFQI